ncbi:MAG: 2-amino-4-hydroxy-6-hydroxymethyldihydropteridine diphosphokinase [Verrucomicrobiota bacterium]
MEICIGLGSNLGKSEVEIEKALEWLSRISLSQVTRSSLYSSAPLDCPEDSPPFINAVALIEYSDGVRYLLTQIKAYEEKRGRDLHGIRNAPRPIDLDILAAGPLEVNLPDLIIPHPRIGERLFVLEPLAELVPDLMVPGYDEKVSLLLEQARKQYPDQICSKIKLP